VVGEERGAVVKAWAQAEKFLFDSYLPNYTLRDLLLRAVGEKKAYLHRTFGSKHSVTCFGRDAKFSANVEI
jgi:hypothetical protein